MITIEIPLDRMDRIELIETWIECINKACSSEDPALYEAAADEILEQELDRIVPVKP